MEIKPLRLPVWHFSVVPPPPATGRVHSCWIHLTCGDDVGEVLKRYSFSWGTLYIKIIVMAYSVAHANLDSSKNMLLLKNPQFLPNHCETLSQ